MKLRFYCGQFPNIAVGNNKFENGYCEVDSVFTDRITELMACPFVQCITTKSIGNVNTEQEEIPYSTFKNRLHRKTKAQILELAAGLGFTDFPAEADKNFIADKILKYKYPNGE